jgi:hypothetical protein
MWIVLIIAMILILLVLLVQGIIGMAGSSVLSIKEFFLNTAWGIIALIAGVASLFFFYVSSKMPKRMRESKSRTRAITPVLYSTSQNTIENNRLMENKKSDIQGIHYTNKDIQETVIDLEAMSLEGFFRDVAFTLNKPAPVIFKGWGNRRLRLDKERVAILGSYIESVRGTCDQYLQLRADMFFAKDKFDYFVKANTMNDKNNLDLIKEEYKDKKWKMEYDRRLKESELEDRQVAREERRAVIKEQEARNAFFTMAIKDFPEMPAPLKAYMFTQVHGRYPEAKRDFDLEEKISDFIMKKYDYDIQNMSYETKKKKEEAETFVEKMKHERNKKFD